MLAVLALISIASPLRLEGDYLVDGKDRLNLARPGQRRLALGPKHALVFEENATGRSKTEFVSKGKTSEPNFSPQIGKWLEDEKFWGRKQANDLKYTNGRVEGDRGISATISGAVLCSGNTALCVMDLRQSFSSSVSVILQVLVRLDPKNPDKPKLLRILPGEGSSNEMGSQAAKRLIRHSGKTYLWLSDRLVLLKPDGTLGRITDVWHRGVPAAQLTDRNILVFYRGASNYHESFDLRDRKYHGITGGAPMGVAPSFDSNWIRADQTLGGKPKSYFINIVDFRHLTAPKSVMLVWKNYGIDRGGAEVKVYDIPTGKLVASLK